ncbi:hypothetical protein ACFQ69_25085 [Streptomyces sp. NPDC056470]
MPISMATGQADGACVALASAHRTLPCEVAVGDVQHELRAKGASLR